RVGVFPAVEAMQAGPAGITVLRGCAVQRLLQPRGESRILRIGRAILAGRRHRTAAQLADDLFEGVRVLRHRFRREEVQREAAGPVARVVALETVGFEYLP